MKQIYLVGGCVRDRLLGCTPKDIDYCVTGYIEAEFLRCFPQAEQIGKTFPVMLVDGCEYAFARTERSTGDGHTDFICDANPNISIEEDLRRRDLTINAIAECETTGAMFYGHPYCKADIKHLTLREVSQEAFQEDPLRILRAARFNALFPDAIVERSLFTACYTARHKLHMLPKERVFGELQKALDAPAPYRFFEFLTQCDCLLPFFKEIQDGIYIPAGPEEFHGTRTVYTHTMRVLKKASARTESPIGRFAALCHDFGKTITDPEILPRHYGHDKAGAELVNNLCDRIGAPNKYREVAILVAEEHMKVHNIMELRPGTAVKLLLRINRTSPLGDIEPILAAFHGDGCPEENLELIRDLIPKLMGVRLPEKHIGRGKVCGEIVMNLRTHLFKAGRNRLESN